MQKRGAVSGFIVIGLLVLIFIAIAVYFKQTYLTPNQNTIASPREVALEAQPVQLFVEQCLQNTLQQAVVTIGKQGGYYQVPTLNIGHEQHRVPYYFYVTNDTSVQNKQAIEEEISQFIIDKIPDCLQKFVSFPYTVSAEKPAIQTTTIDPDTVTVRMIMPTTVTRDAATYTLDLFHSSVAVRLGMLYTSSIGVIQQHTKDPAYIPLGLLTDTAYGQNFTYKLVQYNASFVYRFIDNTTMLFQQPYEFDFAVKYGW